MSRRDVEIPLSAHIQLCFNVMFDFLPINHTVDVLAESKMFSMLTCLLEEVKEDAENCLSKLVDHYTHPNFPVLHSLHNLYEMVCCFPKHQ